MYVLHVEGNTLIVIIYVDDLVLTRNNPNLIFTLNNWLDYTFEMTNLGILRFFLGLQILPLSDGICISQFKYLLDILKRLQMDNYKAYATPLFFLTFGSNSFEVLSSKVMTFFPFF